MGFKFKQVIATLLLMFVAIFVFLPAEAKAEEDLSFYKISSSVSGYFNEAVSPGEDRSLAPAWGKNNLAPALLGYNDSEKTKGVSGWIASSMSASSNTISYASLTEVSGSTSMVPYAYYGAALNSLGLDATASESSGGGMSRKLFGGVMMLLFVLTQGVNIAFQAVIYIMQALNPFRLFTKAVDMVASTTGISSFAVGGKAGAPPSVFEGLATFVADWYKIIHDLSWAVTIPVLMAMLMASLLLFRNRSGPKEKGSLTLKSFAIRVLFITIGIPLLGSLYTSALDGITDVDAGSAGGSNIVMSTFIDFESWAKYHNLNLPTGTSINYFPNGGRATGDTRAETRSLTVKINSMSYGGLDDLSSGTGSDILTDVADINSSVYDSKSVVEDGTNFNRTVDVLNRYMAGDFYYASDWETSFKSNIKKTIDNDTLRKQVDEALDVSSYKEDSIKNNIFFNTGSGGIIGAGEKIVNISTQGTPGTFNDGKISGSNTVANAKRPMSAIAMYNYLSTKFGSHNMIIYSSEKAPSGFVRESHYAVNLVGGGLMGFLYWLNAVALLGAVVVLGFVYALGLIAMNIRRSLMLLKSVPFAMLGSIRGIAKVITITGVMLIEILGTLFLYMFVQGFLVSIPKIVEIPIQKLLNTGSLPDAVINPIVSPLTIALEPTATVSLNAIAGGASIIMTVMSTFVILYFTKQALSIRGVVMKAVNEQFEEIIAAFVLVDGGRSLAQRDASGNHIQGSSNPAHNELAEAAAQPFYGPGQNVANKAGEQAGKFKDAATGAAAGAAGMAASKFGFGNKDSDDSAGFYGTNEDDMQGKSDQEARLLGGEILGQKALGSGTIDNDEFARDEDGNTTAYGVGDGNYVVPLKDGTELHTDELPEGIDVVKTEGSAGTGDNASNKSNLVKGGIPVGADGKSTDSNGAKNVNAPRALKEGESLDAKGNIIDAKGNIVQKASTQGADGREVANKGLVSKNGSPSIGVKGGSESSTEKVAATSKSDGREVANKGLVSKNTVSSIGTKGGTVGSTENVATTSKADGREVANKDSISKNTASSIGAKGGTVGSVDNVVATSKGNTSKVGGKEVANNGSISKNTSSPMNSNESVRPSSSGVLKGVRQPKINNMRSPSSVMNMNLAGKKAGVVNSQEIGQNAPSQVSNVRSNNRRVNQPVQNPIDNTDKFQMMPKSNKKSNAVSGGSSRGGHKPMANVGQSEQVISFDKIPKPSRNVGIMASKRMQNQDSTTITSSISKKVDTVVENLAEDKKVKRKSSTRQTFAEESNPISRGMKRKKNIFDVIIGNDIADDVITSSKRKKNNK